MDPTTLPPPIAEAIPALSFHECPKDRTWGLTIAVHLHGRPLGYMETGETLQLNTQTQSYEKADWHHVILTLPNVSGDLDPMAAICQGHASTPEQAVHAAIDGGLRSGQAYLLSILALKSAISTPSTPKA